MFPIGEEYSGRRSIAVVVFLLLLVNIFVFLVELTGGESFIAAYATVPYEISRGVDLTRPVIVPGLGVIPQAPGPAPIYLTLFTSMFMHVGLLHLAGNMLYLLFDARPAVGVVRVRVQVAPQIGEFNQLRQSPFDRRFDLAAIFAKFGRHYRNADQTVGLVLIDAAEPLLASKYSVLIDLQPLLLCQRAQVNIVLLRAGEVLKRRAVRFPGHGAHIHLNPAFNDHSCARVAQFDHLLDQYRAAAADGRPATG